jgi:hypothetical protein
MTVENPDSGPPSGGTAPPRPPSRRISRTLAAIAIAFLALGLWARGSPAFVAWELARDHERCFGRRHLRARVWSDEATEVRAWLESRGTPTPPLPTRAGGVEIAGARYCALLDRVAAHVFYVGDDGPVSVFLLSGPVRVEDGWAGRIHGLHVRLVRSVGRPLAVVGERERDVDAIARAFASTVAVVPRPAEASAG